MLPPLVPGRRLSNLIARFRDTLGLFRSLQREYGPIVRYKILGVEFCVVSDPALIEEVLYAKRTAFDKGFLYKRSLILPRPTTITGDGEEHKQRRRLIQPYFLAKTLPAHCSVMAEQAVAVRDGWKDGEVFDMEVAAHDLILSVSRKIFLGDNVQVDTETLQRVLRLCLVDIGTAVIPSRGLRRLILSSLPRFWGAYRDVADQVASLVASARADGAPRSDLVSYLARAIDDAGEYVCSVEDVVDSVVEMMIASTTTTAATISWATYYLSRNPAVRQRMEREVDETLSGEVPNIDACSRLRYTGAVIAEVLRLAPPAYYLGRKATQDCTLGDFFIPAGTNVQICYFSSQRDERYFRQPERFRPERWLDTQPARPRCAYMPFGAGTRDCAGEAFAQTNLKCALTSIAQRWQVDPTSEEFPKLNTIASYAFRNGLPVRVRAR